MATEHHRYPALRTRLFVAIALVVVLSIGLTLGIGLVLTRHAVERAKLEGLSRQADLLAQRERPALLAFAHLGPLRRYLAKQNERIIVFSLKRPPDYLGASARADLRRGKPHHGHVRIDGRDELYAGQVVQNKAFLLL